MSDDDFVPYYPPDPNDVARLEALPTSERGGFRVLWATPFEEERDLERLLRQDKRTLLVRFEEGRWYSNGETGAPWYQYHVGCRKDDEAGIIETFKASVIGEMSNEVLNKLDIANSE
jgi:hypothetical protein